MKFPIELWTTVAIASLCCASTSTFAQTSATPPLVDVLPTPPSASAKAAHPPSSSPSHPSSRPSDSRPDEPGIQPEPGSRPRHKKSGRKPADNPLPRAADQSACDIPNPPQWCTQ